MVSNELQDRVLSLSKYIDIILVPGIRNSGPEHWQSFWHKWFPHWHRVSLHDWSVSDADGWLQGISREQEKCNKPCILIGHSFGALMSYLFAQQQTKQIAGIVLVGLTEPIRFEVEDLIDKTPLKIPSIIFASDNDELMPIDRAKFFAKSWGSEFVDLGSKGHINAEAGFGRWEYGVSRIVEFLEKNIIPKK